MKNRLITVLILALCLVLCLAGCGETQPTGTAATTGRQDTGEALAFTQVTVIRRDDTTFDITCDAVENADYYVSTQASYTEADRVEPTLSDGSAAFTVTAAAATQNLYVWVVAGEEQDCRQVVIPQTNLYVYLHDDGSVEVYYNCSNASDLSSVYAAKGKALYKSSKAVFDGDAVLAASGLQLSSESDTDKSYSFKRSYYYEALSTKDGVVTYITPAAQETSCLIQYAYASMTVSEAGVPTLHVDAKAAASEVAYSYRLVLRAKDGDTVTQTLYADNIGTSTALAFDLDMSAITAEGVWYDVYLEIAETGAVYNVSSSMNDGSSAELDHKTYEFKDYGGDLKVNYRMERLTVDGATLELIDGKPMLVVTASLLEGASAADVDAYLEIRYQVDSTKYALPKVYNSSEDPTKMQFCFDLTQMSVAGNWHDIVIVIDGVDNELTSAGVNTSQSVSYGGRTYAFKTWSGLLKVTY